jgi:acyl-[acyl-carrier-protein]-phospholipid O-acyltransferase/long-chain-fatty-acid--[acyl-carrier-protein] ligase
MEGVRAAPIIPVYLDQLWGSIFSFRGGKFFWKVPKEIPYPVTVSFGKPLPADSSASQVRLKVQELGSRAFARRERRHKLLHLAFLSQAKRTPFRLAVSDTLGMKFRYFELLAGILLLRNRFRGRFSTGERVGVLLPAGCTGALTNLALLSQGLVPVNLNHTAGALSRIIERSNISTILTSHKYLEKISIERDPRMLPVEALLQSEDKWERLLLALKALLLPGFFIRRFYFDTEATQDSLATIMFSSGSTGEPKGVMLTHSNISSNCEAIYELLDLGPGDVLLGSLPFFHSFGFTGTLLLPLISGIKTHYHPNPTDAALITRQIAVNRITMLITTPTFLQMYARKASRADLCSLRYIVVGAEKLREGLRAAFREKFGKEILEGYGCTELSPVALVNVPGFGAQIGNKPGTVGRPIPGVSVKVVNPDTLEELSLGESGMLLVAGPNVMAGYLDEPEKTAAVIRDGYYLTGDIASIDEDGFVKIEDRLSRFAKIGGEMVPHLRIEEEIHAVLDSPEQVVAVTSVPDERKGEKLVVVHAVDLDVDRVRSELAAKGLPNLWIPKREDFIRVENLPMLGTGKLDLKGLKEVAASGT